MRRGDAMAGFANEYPDNGDRCGSPETLRELFNLRARIASLESEVEVLRGLLREAVSYVRDIVRMTPTGFNRAALDRIEAALARPASDEER
jgi:hypothetical protein